MLNNVLFFASVLLFRVTLDLSYIFILSEHFTSVGYVLQYDSIRYVLSWLAYFSIFFTLSSKFFLVKHYLFITFALGLWAPLTTMWGLDSNRDSFPVFASFLSFIVVYFSATFFEKVVPLKLPLVKGGRKCAFLLSMSLMLFLIAWYLFSGVKFNFDFSKVYELRSQNQELSAFGFFAYLNNWIYKIFAVYILSWSLLNKNYFASLLVVLVFIFYFAANTHKSVLFTPFLVISIWFYFRKYESMTLIPIGFSFIIIVSMFSFYLLGDIWMSALFANRVFMIPANLTFLYFEFFEYNDFVYYSNSFLKGVIEYPYHTGLAKLIGEYGGHPESAANNGYISSAYAQAGMSAVIFYSVIIGAILAVVDRFVRRGEVPPWFALVILVVPIRDFLISIDLLTTFLTGGMIWAFFLLFLARKKQY